ncbi:MAG: ruvC [Nevskia sp.]|nr:ruvC [Nevskia sp.]
MTRIIGIDPGSRVTGYGIVEITGTRSRWIAHGRIACAAGPLPRRLLQILQQLDAVIREHQPHEAAIEEVFVKNNVATALVLGQARGAAICALAAAGLEVAEYAPASIKSAIVGSGRAEKAQVQHMIKVLLNLNETPPTDAADALAVALCHAHQRGAASLKTVPRTRSAPSWRQMQVDANGKLVKR